MRTQGLLGHVELQILLKLANGPSHGYDLMRAIAESTRGRLKPGPGTLYVAIARLVQAGLAEEVGSAGAHAKARRTYRITGEGLRSVREEVTRLKEIVDSAQVAGVWGGSS
jgi:DNA-binding PadR family transcriptional regulator